MRKFILKIAAFLGISAVCIGAFILFSYYVIGSQYKLNFNASMVDKAERLLSINEPKIIIVGDSNAAFGFDSARIEEEIGMPVVNMGLMGGLGAAFHEQAAQLNINEGDIVALCHYGVGFGNSDSISPDVAWMTYDYNDILLPIFQPKDYKRMLMAYPTHLRKIIALWITGTGNQSIDAPYRRASFNEYGDVVEKPKKPQHTPEKLFLNANVSPVNTPIGSCDRVNRLNDYCTERGASLVVAGFPIAYGEYSDFTVEDFTIAHEKLEKVLECDMISDYSDYFYPYSYFYDTHTHLNEEGVAARTAQFIADLKAWMEAKENR